MSANTTKGNTMAKKAELLEQAKKLKLGVSAKNTITEIESAIAAAGKEAEPEKSEPKAEVAKAGKRSAKAIKEEEEKQAKEERKQAVKDTDEPKQPAKKAVKPARSVLERKGKKFREAAKLIDTTKHYELKEALELAQKTSTTKFDATVELHIKLGVDPRQADQNVRGTVGLPAGSGKSVKIAVFADDEDIKKAKAAGADVAGNEDFLQQLDKEVIDFDVLIATPTQMAKLGKYARLLGPKGLMPNPKSGTVSANVAAAVKEAKAGKVEYRVDSTGIIHLGVGKVSFGTDDLLANTNAVLGAIKAAKPASLKSTYIQTVHITTSMGPSIKINPSVI